MFRLILNILFLIILAIFIALNTGYKTDINIFSRILEDVSVVVIVLLSISIGIIFALFSFGISRLVGKERERVKESQARARQKDKEFDDREHRMLDLIEKKLHTLKKEPMQLPDHSESTQNSDSQKKRPLLRFFQKRE